MDLYYKYFGNAIPTFLRKTSQRALQASSKCELKAHELS